MDYLLMAMEDEDAFEAREDPARSEAYWTSWRDYIDALTASGILRGAAGLEVPSVSTTVRVREGKRLVQDGPFADTKEQLGGYFVLQVDDIDEALRWAERCPAAAYGSVELRPVLPAPPPREVQPGDPTR